MNDRSYISLHRGHPHYFTQTQLRSFQKDLNFSNDQEKTINLIKALSDKTKLKIFLLLHKVPEMSVTDITKILGVSQSAVSHALTDLKKLKIVEAHRCGQLICYSLVKKTL